MSLGRLVEGDAPHGYASVVFGTEFHGAALPQSFPYLFADADPERMTLDDAGIDVAYAG